MHCHNMAEGVVEGHPLTDGLADFLKEQKLTATWIEFLKKRLFFAYPRTAWFKLDAEHPSDVKLRHEIDVRIAGDALRSWLWRPGGFSHVVFDVRKITILDRQGMLDFFERASSPDHPSFILASKEVGTQFFARNPSPTTRIFFEERDLLAFLRNTAQDRQTTISLPHQLSLLSLDETLRAQASDAALDLCDVATFDFSKVRGADFNAISTLAPLLHSMAHKKGVLFAVQNPSPKFSPTLMKYAPLRVVAPYLVAGREFATASEETATTALAMKCFTDAETLDIQDLCLATFNSLLEPHISWFVAQAGLSTAVAQSRYHRVADLIKQFRQIVKELVENVSMHAQGLGYLMMDLAPHPGKGLSIFVGDTGVGLAKGIWAAYKFRPRSDVHAVSLVLEMKDRLRFRRKGNSPFVSGGRGLERVANILIKLKGQLSVRSGTALAEFNPAVTLEPLNVHKNLYPIDGTQLHIFLPTL